MKTKIKILLYILSLIKILINYERINANFLSSEPKIIDTKFYDNENHIDELPLFPNEENSIVEISGINFDVI
jgi:hypothetical protein